MQKLDACVSGSIPSELVAPEMARQRAMIACDVETLSALLGEPLVYIHSAGQCDDKRIFLQRLTEAFIRYRSMNLDVQAAIAFGTKAWLLKGRLLANVQIGDHPADIDAVFTATWSNQELGWQMMSWQSTPWPTGI